MTSAASSSSTYLIPAVPPPLESPGSTTCSSIVSGTPVTPLDELEKMSGDLVISDNDEDEDEDDTSSFAAALHKPVNITLDSIPVHVPSQSPFAGFSFGAIDIPPRPSLDMVSPQDVAMPSEGFTFGSYRSRPHSSTPTAESGPFEYPTIPPFSAGPSRKTSINSPKKVHLPLGQTHRRGSIVAQSVAAVIPSPPASRRSSTCSVITTLPIAGRRPSILHSATSEIIPPPLAPFPSTPGAGPGPSSRRSSIMFQQKTLPAPIPPSLLARRGSVPAAQLFGLPTSEQLKQPRESYSAGSHTTTTAALYRRQSMVSESGVSSGSDRTIAAGDGLGRRSSTRSVHSPKMFSNHFDSTFQANLDRRPSLPFRTSPARGSLTRQSLSAVPSQHRTIPASPSFTSRQNSLASASSASTSSSFSIPGSPISRFAERRARQSSSLHSSLSSSEESNEDDADDEELPTPSGSAFSVMDQGRVPSAPLFSDPWAGSAEAEAGGVGAEGETLTMAEPESMAVSVNMVQKELIPLDTPPLETVTERPMLESTDSNSTVRG